MRTIVLATAVAAVVVTAWDGSSGYLHEQAQRRRLAEIGVERFDSAEAYRLAGMSTRERIEIEPLRPRALGADTLDPAYHLLHMRCGTCHVVPAPESRPGFLWDAEMPRMRKNVRDAGLLPIRPDEEKEILRFLREHASDRR